jgi:hypothetical protein
VRAITRNNARFRLNIFSNGMRDRVECLRRMAYLGPKLNACVMVVSGARPESATSALDNTLRHLRRGRQAMAQACLVSVGTFNLHTAACFGLLLAWPRAATATATSTLTTACPECSCDCGRFFAITPRPAPASLRFGDRPLLSILARPCFCDFRHPRYIFCACNFMLCFSRGVPVYCDAP